MLFLFFFLGGKKKREWPSYSFIFCRTACLLACRILQGFGGRDSYNSILRISETLRDLILAVLCSGSLGTGPGSQRRGACTSEAEVLGAWQGAGGGCVLGDKAEA